jgi:hypothetical protein
MPLRLQRAILVRAKPQIATKLLDRRRERMWPCTNLIDRLEIEHALLLAPMGGETTPEMVIAVANAGGLGDPGCSYMSNDGLRDQVAQIRSGTAKSFNLNFFVHPEPEANADIYKQAFDSISPFYDEPGIDAPPYPLDAPCESFGQSRLECLLELRPRVFSFHFGLPEIDMVRALQDIDCLAISSATTVAEADLLDPGGVTLGYTRRILITLLSFPIVDIPLRSKNTRRKRMTDRKTVAVQGYARDRANIFTGTLCLLLTLLAGFYCVNSFAAEPREVEQVSFRCALAIDAVLARLDEQIENLVVKQALDRITEQNGQLVCISISADEIQVRLQASDMTAADNRLVFSLDAKTYKVLKTYYGR